jgi:NitT/TauT family transport system ATP-binding protein
MSEPYRIIAGFLPLLDSALLVAAREKGFAANENVELVLVRENSWASIRDRLAVGHFNVAHMLAPMPIACNLGLSPLAAKTIAPMALGLGGNAVTVSLAVWKSMRAHGAETDFDPAIAGAALKAVVAERIKKNLPPLRFSVVHPQSGHNYELRYWLAASGIDPDKEMEIVIVPPPLTPEALAAGHIDGYCVGEPWNTAAVKTNVGRIVTAKAAIWRSSPEKVLGVAEPWARSNPEALSALLRALYAAAQWCGAPENREELAKLLSARDYIGCPAAWLLPALTGVMAVSAEEDVAAADFFVPHAKAATFPWRSHALWFYSQMVRWGHVAATPANEAIARDTYRADLYRAALKPLGVALPGASAKVEGALRTPTRVGAAGGSLILGPDGFFDGKIFDPDRIDDYLGS